MFPDCPDNCFDCSSVGPKRFCAARGCYSGFIANLTTGECDGMAYHRKK